jgi:hypothetical protein
VKFAQEFNKFGAEINIMKRIYKKSQFEMECSTPEVVEYGIIIQSDDVKENQYDEFELMSFVIMPRYGANLEM